MLLACTGPIREPQAPAPATDEPSPRPAEDEATVAVEPEPAIPSFHDQIYAGLEAGPDTAIVLFSDNQDLMAVSDTGRTLRLTESFPHVVIDYQSGLLWMYRAYDRELQNGLFVADLFASHFEPLYVSLPDASWQLINAAGETYPLGSAAYTTTIDATGVHTRHYRDPCGNDDCEIPPEVAELVAKSLARGYPIEPKPHLEVIGVENYRVVKRDPNWEEAGRLVELPGVRWDAISVPTRGDLLHIQWNLYDPVAETYHSAKTLKASQRRWNIEDVIVHLMICREHTVLVLDHRLFSAEGELLFEGSYPSRGVCLHGGAVFDARDLLSD
jgi:hypothetical protein